MEENPTEASTRIKTKLNKWIKELEDINDGSDNYKHTLQNSYKKFEDSIEEMVRDAPDFSKKIKAASPENRETLMTIGSFMREVIKELIDNIKDVEV